MAYQKLARRLKFLIASYRRHGAAHVAEVFRQERIRRAYASAPASAPSPDELPSLFPGTTAATFLQTFRANAAQRLPIGPADRGELFTALAHSLGTAAEADEDAGHIAHGRFEALGVCIDEPGGEFDWSRDYGSSHRWPTVPFNAIAYMEGDGSDVKYAWEPSRMAWISWLGIAAWTGDRAAHAATFTRLVDDWRAANPMNVGVNWAMPMEVAIRGFWLAMGFAFFGDEETISGVWWQSYLAWAFGHGRYLIGNLEYFSNLTNHYISNCLGLIALGTLFAGSAEGDHWRAEGRRRMIAELEHQVLPDGVHYERSIGYHRLVTEMYLVAAILLERAGEGFGAAERARIERMCEFIGDYVPPAGTVPQFGDSDDGVILRLSMAQSLYDHRDTLALAGAFFDRADLQGAAGGISMAALVMLGPERLERAAVAPALRRRPSRLYSEGGFAILRTQDLHVVADVGEIGLHGNNDTLAFTLHGRSGAFIVDPGTYCYTRSAALRNELRSTRAHNAPCLDDTEIAAFDGLWRVRRDRTRVRVAEWRLTPAATALDAEHRAYASLDGGGMLVRRRWELAGAELRVSDFLTGRGTHRVAVRFTFPEDVHVTMRSSHALHAVRPSGEVLELECSEPLVMQAGWYSPSYGCAARATYVDVACAFAPASRRTHEITYICRLLSNS